MLKEAAEKYFPQCWERMLKFLSDDKKFLTGDSLSIYDIQIGTIFTDLLCNPNAKDAELWKAEYEKVPDRIKKFHTDFVAEMKDYLDARPKDCTI